MALIRMLRWASSSARVRVQVLLRPPSWPSTRRSPEHGAVGLDRGDVHDRSSGRNVWHRQTHQRGHLGEVGTAIGVASPLGETSTNGEKNVPPGIVHDDVDPSVPLDHGGHEGRQRLGVAYVEHTARRVVGLAELWRPVAQSQGRTELAEESSGGGTDAGRSSGDEHHLAAQAEDTGLGVARSDGVVTTSSSLPSTGQGGAGDTGPTLDTAEPGDEQRRGCARLEQPLDQLLGVPTRSADGSPKQPAADASSMAVPRRPRTHRVRSDARPGEVGGQGARMRPITACFEAQYAAMRRSPSVPAADATATTRDRVGVRVIRAATGTAAAARLRTPSTLTPKSTSHWASGVSHMGGPPPTAPATATAAWRSPK